MMKGRLFTSVAAIAVDYDDLFLFLFLRSFLFFSEVPKEEAGISASTAKRLILRVVVLGALPIFDSIRAANFPPP